MSENAEEEEQDPGESSLNFQQIRLKFLTEKSQNFKKKKGLENSQFIFKKKESKFF